MDKKAQKKREKLRLKEEKFQRKEILRKEKKAARIAAQKAKLEAFKSIEGFGDAISFIFGYGKSLVLNIAMLSIGYLAGTYNVIPGLLQKFGIISQVVK